jgi:DNA-binding response OmpR family regulator
MKGDLERFLQSGMDGYVSKPIRPEELARVIESLTQTSHGPGRGAEGLWRIKSLAACDSLTGSQNGNSG